MHCWPLMTQLAPLAGNYRIKVMAGNENGDGSVVAADFSISSTPPTSCIPEPVSNLVARSAMSRTEVQVTWAAPQGSCAVAEYEVGKKRKASEAFRSCVVAGSCSSISKQGSRRLFLLTGDGHPRHVYKDCGRDRNHH